MPLELEISQSIDWVRRRCAEKVRYETCCDQLKIYLFGRPRGEAMWTRKVELNCAKRPEKTFVQFRKPKNHNKILDGFSMVFIIESDWNWRTRITSKWVSICLVCWRSMANCTWVEHHLYITTGEPWLLSVGGFRTDAGKVFDHIERHWDG